MKKIFSVGVSTTFFSIAFFITISCKKTEDTPTPVPTPTPIPTPSFSGCRITQISQDVIDDPVVNFEIVKFNYDKDGFITNTETTLKRNTAQVGFVTWRMTYKDGLLEKYNDSEQKHIEVYEYVNSILSAIKIPTSNTPDLVNLAIKTSADVSKRIIKMEDNRGGITTIKRDTKENITEIKKIDGTDESFRMEITGYDNKKSIYELMKGFQFDTFALADSYMEKPLFSVGASGNPLKAKVFRKGILKEDLEFSYEYTSDGYPTKITSTNILFNKVITQTIEYEGCK
jgi:hypothetical protein